MEATLILRSPLLTGKGIPIERLDLAVQTSGAELERDIKENIQQSTPAGRTYRRGAIIRKPSRRTAGLGLQNASRGRGIIVGFKFHRASARGQAPAIDTGRLINSIAARRIGIMRARVGVSVSYALPLDDPEGLYRPFFSSRVRLYRSRYFVNIRKALLGTDA